MTLRTFFDHALQRRLAAELLGTGLLLTTVVGSGIMAERLAGGNAALALLANSLATGAMLFVLIVTLAPLSGAHFNPLVTMIDAFSRRLPRGHAACYVAVQVIGAALGTVLANLMFELPPIHPSQHARSGAAQALSELVATFGLIGVILHAGRRDATTVAALVACYITAAYWFTASTAFANPAATLARSLTDTFAGIRISDVPLFMLAQFIGAVLAYAVYRWMSRER